jgi:hypothetical protein
MQMMLKALPEDPRATNMTDVIQPKDESEQLLLMRSAATHWTPSARSKVLCPELVFPILFHRLLRHALRTNFLHAIACDRPLCRRNRSSITPFVSQQGPNDTCHFVGERNCDEHARLACKHALQP